jgi:hypothetical protein
VVIDCDREPEVAVTTKATGPGVMSALAVITTVCDKVAEARVKVAGLAETPAGNPERTTLTALENPFAGATEMEMVWEEFGVTAISAGIESEKSGVAGAAWLALLLLELPLPQPTIASAAASKTKRRNRSTILHPRLPNDSGERGEPKQAVDFSLIISPKLLSALKKARIHG